MRLNSVLWLSVTLLIISCSSEEIVPERFYPRNDHEAYQHSLKQANLIHTALGKDWLAAAQKPFDETIEVHLPYEEFFIISEIKPDAHGYRFEAKRGQAVLVSITSIHADTTRLFADLFRVESDSLGIYKHVASADSTLRLGFEPRRNAEYILRIQPELLRGGQFTVTVESVPTLDFPVAGKDKAAIHSVFGDPRDGGKREHHGVDIFAKRHTPVIAPVDGKVRFAGTRGIGGKVVWLRDTKRGNSLYFAHLEDYKVKRYDRVKAGDTLGTVGNSGNARTTAPHLHFGIYKNGPLDPYSFIVPVYENVPAIIPDTTLLGSNLSVDADILSKADMKRILPIDSLAEYAQVQVVGLSDNHVRLKMENGSFGMLKKSDLYENKSFLILNK